MTNFYKLGLLLLVAGPAAAQAPTAPAAPAAPRPLPTSFRGGSYQLRHGDWQRGKLLYDAQNLSVSDADHKPQYPLVYPADSVRAFVVGRDTFATVRELDVPRPAQHLRSAFVRQLYRRGGFQVGEYVAYLAAPSPAIAYTVLTRPGELPTVLPANNTLFRVALAKTLRDYQALSQQLELDPKIIPDQLPDLLTAYGRWKSANPTRTAAK